MSSNPSTNQFIPSALKKVSIIFFCIVIVGIIGVISLSPQLTRDKSSFNLDSKSITPTNSKPSKASASGSADLLATNPTPTSSSIESMPATLDESTLPTPLPTTSQVQSEKSNKIDDERCQFSGTSEAKIIGIIFDNNRYFYTPGSQPYYALQKLKMVEKWFCYKAAALEQGWIEGPPDILELRNKSNSKNQETKSGQSGGIVNSLLKVLGM